MCTLQERLLQFLDYKNINMQTFERKCGIGQGLGAKLSIKSYATTFRRLTDAFPELNIDWLKTGEGEMLKPVQNLQANSGGQNLQNNGSGNAQQNNGVEQVQQGNHNKQQLYECDSNSQRIRQLEREKEGLNSKIEELNNLISEKNKNEITQNERIFELKERILELKEQILSLKGKVDKNI